MEIYGPQRPSHCPKETIIPIAEKIGLALDIDSTSDSYIFNELRINGCVAGAISLSLGQSSTAPAEEVSVI
jgi:hypothetical protein